MLRTVAVGPCFTISRSIRQDQALVLIRGDQVAYKTLPDLHNFDKMSFFFELKYDTVPTVEGDDWLVDLSEPSGVTRGEKPHQKKSAEEGCPPSVACFTLIRWETR